MNIRDRQILKIALPSIVSNITVPLLGMIDVAIVGHMGSSVYIGAVAVGSMIWVPPDGQQRTHLTSPRAA